VDGRARPDRRLVVPDGRAAPAVTGRRHVGPGGEDPGPDPALLGDIVLCPQVAATQAKQAGHSAQAEMELLTVHGILHLLGYDHADPEEEAEMFGLQGQLLTDWRADGGRTGAPAPDGPGGGAGPGNGEGPG